MPLDHSLTRRSLLTTAALGAGLAALRMPAMAQAAYPTRPVKLIVPYAAGGGTDLGLSAGDGTGGRP